MMIGTDDGSKANFQETVMDALRDITQMVPHELTGNDVILNRYFVSHMGETLFKKEREVAKADLLKVHKVANLIETKSLEVMKLDQTQKVIGLTGKSYCLDLQIRKGAMTLDTDKLHGLLVARGIRRDEVTSILEEAKVKQRPAIIFGVSQK